jgi:subtilisin family serine protease
MYSRLLLLVTLILAAAPASAAQTRDFLPGELLLTVKAGTNVSRLARDYRLTVIGQQSGGTTFRVTAPPRTDVNNLARLLTRDSRVTICGPNLSGGAVEAQFAPAQPLQQWVSIFDGGGSGAQHYATQPAIPQVNFGPTAAQADGSGVIVAILDTGIAPHPALAGQLIPGWNFVDNSADTTDRPTHLDTNANGHFDEAVGHGTMIAGLVARFAPRARLLPVKVLNSDGMGNVWDLISGIRYAVARGAKVINLSLGFRLDSSLLNAAIQDSWQAGVVVVTSAGNANSERPQFPAATSIPVTVAALDNQNRKASFSNFGSPVDLDAPGVEVVSTFWDGNYASWSGTSFSTGIITAAVALVRSVAPGLRADKVVRLIQATSHNVDAQNPAFRGKLDGGGGGGGDGGHGSGG